MVQGLKFLKKKIVVVFWHFLAFSSTLFGQNKGGIFAVLLPFADGKSNIIADCRWQIKNMAIVHV